jgi:hypothetical protein
MLAVASLLVTSALTACGTGQSSSQSTPASTAAASASTTAASASTTTTSAGTAAPLPPPAHLRILAPRGQSHIDRTVAVHVALTGAHAAGSRAFRYVLDGSFTRVGPARLTLHDVVPGHHHLVVALASRPSVKAIATFFVTAPAPTPPAAPASVSSSPPPATMTTAPAPTPAPSPAPSSGIPQGPSAGDADGDNHGGPSDGDGNI